MLKPCYLLIILIAISCGVYGQARTMNGYLSDSITHFPIINGTVTNARSKKSVHSNEKGFFRLEAAPNDFIYAYAKSYHYDTLVYSLIFTDTITLYLSPAGNILPNVTVTTKYNKYQLDSIERRTAFEQIRGTAIKTLSTSHPSGFGLTFNLDKFFQNKYKNQKRQENMFNATEQMAYINYRFSKYTVAYFTGLKGDELRSFCTNILLIIPG
ncbi:MAG: hypothetical protein WKG06_23910 [Segetibacter sp.]